MKLIGANNAPYTTKSIQKTNSEKLVFRKTLLKKQMRETLNKYQKQKNIMVDYIFKAQTSITDPADKTININIHRNTPVPFNWTN